MVRYMSTFKFYLFFPVIKKVLKEFYWSYLSSKSVVVNCGDNFALQQAFGDVWRHFFLSQLGKRRWHVVDGGQIDAATHSTMHRTVPYDKEKSGPNVSGAKFEKS